MTTPYTRRKFLKRAAGFAGATAASVLLPAPFAIGQKAKIRVGLMLPYTGTWAEPSIALENGFHLALAERGGKLGGRELEIFKVDDEADPAKAPENTNRLVQRDKIDVLVGTIHSGVGLGMVKITRETGTLNLVCNAGADAITGALCAPNIFRTSFSNWQLVYPLGKVLIDRGIKNVVHIAWKYTAGEEDSSGFRDGYVRFGGKIIKQIWVPFPSVEFQPLLTEIASIKPDAVVAWVAGAAGAKFIRDYAAAGLKGKIPLVGSGAMVEGNVEAAGDAGQGIETTLHYGDGIDTKRNREFVAAYVKAHKRRPDYYAMQGFDTAQVLGVALDAVKGEVGDKQGMIKAIEKAKIDSPRGVWTMSSAHNPIQDIYLRKIIGKEDKVIAVAWKALADPARGCKLA